jgi:hypothetical protein
MSSLFSIRGRIAALGQSEFNSDVTKYSCVDFAESSGRRIKVYNVLVRPIGNSSLALGSEGEFFFDKLHGLNSFSKHLYAAQLSTGEHFLRQKNLRLLLGIYHLVIGTITSFLFVGIPVLLIGAAQLLRSVPISIQKHALFYGDARRVETLRSQPVLEM